jgi:hypothetical protein
MYLCHDRYLADVFLKRHLKLKVTPIIECSIIYGQNFDNSDHSAVLTYGFRSNSISILVQAQSIFRPQLMSVGSESEAVY